MNDALMQLLKLSSAEVMARLGRWTRRVDFLEDKSARRFSKFGEFRSRRFVTGRNMDEHSAVASLGAIKQSPPPRCSGSDALALLFESL